MGLCFSKKQQEKPSPPPPVDTKNNAKKPSSTVVVADEKKKTPHLKKAPKTEDLTADKKAVFVVKNNAVVKENGEEKKRPQPQEEAKPVVVSTVPVRTSSCTKEEVDAILIQCGRLSRSSSGKAASSETGGGHRRYSGSKRSYDFDQERRAGGGGDEECDWERQGVAVSRPSPHRRTPERKRSGSRDRSNGGSRRASRSPGRRPEGAPGASTASCCSGERVRQQPVKMVSVPAREKGRAPSPAATSGKRCASPRSNSPARAAAAAAAGNENAGGGQTAGQTPSLNRSSSRKAEHSPYRRSPMAELDENALRNNNNNISKPKKSTENAVAATPRKTAERAKDQTGVSCQAAKEKPEIVEETVAASDTKAPSAKTNATRTVSVVADSLHPRAAGLGCRPSSRRSSRDFDQNPNSYASQLLEDIQNYHHQQNTSAAAPAFELPACVSKACSILEAVADLNSTSENRTLEPDLSADDKVSINATHGKDGLTEPSLHKYVSVRDIRGETEPQESAGSNSVSGHPWTCSWEPNSVESTDRTWTASRSNNTVDEAEQGSSGTLSPLGRPLQSKTRPSRTGSGVSAQRGRSAHRGGGSAASGRSGVRAVSASS